MLNTLYGKFAAVLLVLFCSIGALYILLTIFTTRMYLQEVNQKFNRTLAKDLVTDRLLTSQGEVNPEALKEIFHMLMVINPNIEIYLLEVTVRIADTGCGISEQDLPYIFDRFYRVDRNHRSDGAGLGLAITKRILELHGSRIHARSQLKAGTTLTFHLPAYTPSLAAPHPSPSGRTRIPSTP